MSASSWDEAAALSASPAVPAESARWSAATRVAFRFAFSYLVLYNFPFPFNLFWDGAFKYEELWHTIVTAVAKRFFAIEITVFTNGSGDTTYDYIKVLCLLVVAAAATLVWSILDRRRLGYARLHEWLRVYVRFTLAASMMSYGAYKVIKSQFPDPGIDRLLQPFGDASPMGLLWTFMGASLAYNIFTGAGEILGGLLLTFRRTTLLGALVTIAVMSNIVALNFSYDVPVKLYSTHLLLMGVFLVLPDARRLVQFFTAHQRPLADAKWLRIGGVALRTALVLFVLVTTLRQSLEARIERTRQSPLRGIWNVDTLVVDGVNRPPLITDDLRWRRIVFDQPDVIAFYPMKGRRTRYMLALNEKQRTMLLQKGDNSGWKATLTYRRPFANTMIVDGAIDGRNYHLILRKAEDEASFRLTTRGFHWINEYPFNR